MNASMGATVCTFTRTAEGPREVGIAVAPDPGTYDVWAIIDSKGKLVTELYNYHLDNYRGCFVIELREEETKPVPKA